VRDCVGQSAPLGTEYFILLGGPMTGAFSSFITPYFFGSEMFAMVTTPGGVAVEVVPAPEPALLPIMVGGLRALAGLRRRR
jgi:hypothetical protein